MDVRVDRAAERLRELVVAGEESPHAELLLGLSYEVLLSRDAHEVRVGVAVADVREGVLAAQPLVAGLDVDQLIGGVGEVEVALVDVHVDATDRVDEPEKRCEVEIDHVVDRDAGEGGLDDREHEVDLSDRVRRVELPFVGLAAPAEADEQVAGDREDRGLSLRGIHPHEHEGVRVQQMHPVHGLVSARGVGRRRPDVVVADDHDRLRRPCLSGRQLRRLDRLPTQRDVRGDRADRSDHDYGDSRGRAEDDRDAAEQIPSQRARARSHLPPEALRTTL